MAGVTYDDGSFFVDGQRIWLVSGSVHYFRTPAALWRDRLLKAKRAGLNCVSTYLAWDFHEPVEGQWELSGDKDPADFVRLAGELGLYVILRPGPYIGGDWDFGGLPGWLAGKSGITFRTANAAYLHYFDKYFRQVLPRLAELQVTRGGNIILIQNENQYVALTMPDRPNYLEFINQLFRRSGFDIPIISCNDLTEPPAPEAIECVRGWADAAQELKRLSVRQSEAPRFVMEYCCGLNDVWGSEHRTRDARETARRAMEILGCGAQYNYYMWHGGTNFGFWGGRLIGSDQSYQTTSYDCDAPLAEGGGLTEKYYITRLVNMLAGHMGRFFAASYVEEPGVTVHDSTSVLNLSGSQGRWAVVTNNGRDDITEASISLPGGENLQLSLEPFGAAAVPMDVQLTDAAKLDYANLTPLGFFKQKVLVLHGRAGWQGRISINGSEIQAVVPDGQEPTVVEHQELVLVVISSDLAMRTWVLEDGLVLGPRFVGEDLEEVVCDAGDKQYTVVAMDGKVCHKRVKPLAPARLAAPRLTAWKRISVCREPVARNLEWQKIDRPRDVDRVGVHYGYVWYRLVIEESRARKRHLYLPGCEDRATLYLNGKRLGVWGRGQGAKRCPIAADFKKGKNVLAMLVDNLGRLSSGYRLGRPKGLFGRVYEAKVLPTSKFKLKPVETFARRIVPRNLAYMTGLLQQRPLWEAQLSIPLTEVAPIHLSFVGLPYDVAICCNERTVAFLPAMGDNFGDVILGSELKKGKNLIKLLLWGDVEPEALEKVRFHTLVDSLSQGAKMSFRPWQMPGEGDVTVGKGKPAWYRTTFKCTAPGQPLFLCIAGAKKGQIFLNGHNVGRFWSIGPQERYYLPECWLREDGANELLLFCENGLMPSRSRLEFRPQGPYRP